ncbi:hypothetical protein [uncultured Tateyamaria sp.]|uniref:hypothetical protein n=1 Tax=uncultured Tateyamaria sp. TaxID=455651 RepID=UPI002607A0CB|nr:hypothetical protein [uncultured Tateyamaria sp.]
MFRSLAALVLSLALVVTSHSAAMARGSATAVDQMVICTGATVMTVYVDRDGQPTKAPHLCPDCALHIFAAAVPPATHAGPAFTVVTLHPWQPAVRHARAAVKQALARAPPVLM